MQYPYQAQVCLYFNDAVLQSLLSSDQEKFFLFKDILFLFSF